MDWLSFIPLVAVLVGTLMSALLGITISKLSDIQRLQREANGRCRDHAMAASFHLNPNSFDRLEEQIKTLYNTVKLAHARIDHLKESG